MRVILATLCLILGQTSYAAAESFTFTVNFEPPVAKTVTVGDNSATLTTSAGKYVQKWTSGATTTGEARCTTWSTGKEEGFDSRGLCETKDNDGGTADFLFSCNYLKENRTESVCWGEQSGKGGRFDGRTGTVTWGQKNNIASGGGLWKD